MILNVVKGDQNKLSDHHYKVYRNITVGSTNIIYDGRGIDEGENINKNQAVSLQCPRGSVDVYGKYILETFLHVIHVPENPVLDPSGNKLLQFCDMGVKIMDGLVNRLYIFLIVFKVTDCFITDPYQYIFRFLLILIRHVRAGLKVKIDRHQGRTELAQVLQRFFTSAKSTSDIKNQRKDNGNTQEGQIQIVSQVKVNGNIGHDE